MHVENDVNLAALGEQWRGIAHGLEDFVFLSIGTGLGGGLVLRGELHRGHHGAAGEVDYALGGDLERENDPAAVGVSAYAARLTAEGRLATTLEPPFDVRAIFAAARAGDELARAVVAEEAQRIAAHVVPIAAVADVALVVLGGGIGTNADLLLEPIRALLAEHCRTRRASRSRARRRRGVDRRARDRGAVRARERLQSRGSEKPPRSLGVHLCAPDETLDLHPLLGCVRTDAARTEDDRRDAGRTRTAPRRSRTAHPRPRDAGGRATAWPRALCRVGLERRPAEHEPRARVDTGGERRHLGGDRGVGLARKRAPLALQRNIAPGSSRTPGRR